MSFADPGAADVGLPAGAPVGTVSGWNVDFVHFYHHVATDTLYVGVECTNICGDADGDGDGGTTSPWLTANFGSDLPDYGGTEFLKLILDTNNNGLFNSGGPDVIAGISSFTDISGIAVATFTGSAFAPSFSFGAPLPNAVTAFASPNALTPDFEFTIAAFSTLPGYVFTPGTPFDLGFNLAHGSLSDDGIGEDFVPGTAVLSSLPLPVELQSFLVE